MSDDKPDILEILKYELKFLENNGDGRCLSMPWKWSSTFPHSPSCINFSDPQRSLPCTDCLLIEFVPPETRSQDIPCHQIPLGPNGETVGNMETQHDVMALERRLRNWLVATIQRIEQQRAAGTALGRSA